MCDNSSLILGSGREGEVVVFVVVVVLTLAHA